MDEDDHKRHEVPDGIQQHESHYLACKVSTLDHSWAAHEAGKQETSREHIGRDCIGRSKNCCRYPFSSLKAKSCSKGWFPFAPEVLTRINYPEVNVGRARTNKPSLKNMFSFKHLRNLTWLYWKAKFVLLYWIMDLIRLYSRQPESNVWIYAVLKRHLAASSFQGICGEWDTQLLHSALWSRNCSNFHRTWCPVLFGLSKKNNAEHYHPSCLPCYCNTHRHICSDSLHHLAS